MNQKIAKEEGPDDYKDIELITIDELKEIRKIWVNEKHEFDDSLPQIYQDVTGRPFEDPDFAESSTFTEEEWNILKDVCQKLYPEEELSFEMVYSLIDIENKALQERNRKGLIDHLESSIKSTFYKNEKDATVYYEKQLSRKRELGGKYNEKFFDVVRENEFELEYDD